MVTIEYLEQLNKMLNKDCKIHNNEFIPDDIIDYLQNHNAMIPYAFNTDRPKSGTQKSYFFNYTCSQCGTKGKKCLSKTKLVEFLTKKTPLKCETCEKNRERCTTNKQRRRTKNS